MIRRTRPARLVPALVAALLATAPLGAVAQETAAPAAAAETAAAPATPRIRGELTAETFDRFAAFAEKNADGNVFGLDLSVAERQDDGSGRAGLSAYDDGTGLLVIYEPRAPDDAGGIQISAREGVRREDGRFVLDGIFTTEYAGMHQGITAIVLKPAPANAAPPALSEIAVGELPDAPAEPEEN